MTAPPARTRGLLAVLVAIAIAYVPSLGGDFVWDDVPLVRDNPAVRDPFDLATIFGSGLWQFTTAPSTDYYRPLVTWTFAVDMALGGGSPVVGHITILLLLLGVVTALWLLVRRLSGSEGLALGAAMLFGLHPLATECTAWISGRGELIAALGVLGGLATWARDDHRAPVRAAALLAFGMLGKESAGLLLPLCGLLDAARGRRHGSLERLMPLAVALCAVIVLRMLAVGMPHTTPPDRLVQPLVAAGLDTRLATIPRLVWTAATQWLAPIELAADYSFAAAPVANGITLPVVGGSLLGALALLALARGRQRMPAVAAGLAFATVAAAPYLANTLVPFTNLFAERFVYLPSAGFAVALAALASRLGRRRALRATACVVAVALGARTTFRAADWTDGVRLFETAVAAAPQSAVAHQNLGEQLAARGETERARAAFERALAIDATFVAPRLGLANLALDAGRPRDALRWLDDAAAQASSASTAALLSRGEALAALGDLPAAAAAFEAGRGRAPWDSRFTSNLASIRYREGDRHAAESLWSAAIAQDPRDFLAHYNLASLWDEMGHGADAQQAYARFLAIVPAVGYDDLVAHARTRVTSR